MRYLLDSRLRAGEMLERVPARNKVERGVFKREALGQAQTVMIIAAAVDFIGFFDIQADRERAARLLGDKVIGPGADIEPDRLPLHIFQDYFG